MQRLTPALEFDNPEKIRKLVMQITGGEPEPAEKLVILLRLITNPERSQIANGIALDDAVNYAFMMTEAFDTALTDFVREPLKAVA